MILKKVDMKVILNFKNLVCLSRNLRTLEVSDRNL